VGFPPQLRNQDNEKSLGQEEDGYAERVYLLLAKKKAKRRLSIIFSGSVEIIEEIKNETD